MTDLPDGQVDQVGAAGGSVGIGGPELDEQIWHVVLRGAVTKSDIVTAVGIAFNLEPTKGTLQKVDKALADLVTRGCLVVMAQEYRKGPTDPKQG
ncbi:hypothetical protein [Streptomyces anulatus]|uniref:hypothetical protein n=1 Tax=Streptomyces anulatus TaxID=1892 RepID=UPI0036650AA3